MGSSAIFTKAASDWQDMNHEYLQHVDYQYLAAVEATSGVLVNKAGRSAGVDGFDLFRGSTSRAQRYASEELLEFWKQNPRLTLSQFEKQWVTGMEQYQ